MFLIKYTNLNLLFPSDSHFGSKITHGNIYIYFHWVLFIIYIFGRLPLKIPGYIFNTRGFPTILLLVHTQSNLKTSMVLIAETLCGNTKETGRNSNFNL